MLTNRIAYKGIARASSNEDVANGWLDEMINLRHRGGKLQAIGHKTKKWNVPGDETGTALTWEKIWYHDQDNISNFIGLTDTHELRLINMELSTSELIKSYSDEVDVVFLKRFLIVKHSTGIDRFLYNDGVYQEISINIEPKFSLSVSDETEVTLDQDNVQTPEGLLGKYRAKLNDLSKENKIVGGMTVRAAFKLFDGSYVMHTLPYFVSTNKFLISLHRLQGYYYSRFFSAKVNVTFNTDEYNTSVQQIDFLQLLGTDGTAEISAAGIVKEVTLDTDTATTVQSFVTNHAAEFSEKGVTIEVGTDPSWGDHIVFSADITGKPFASPSIENLTGDFSGTTINNQENYSGIDRASDIVQSVVLFATKYKTLVEVSEDTINEPNFDDWFPSDGSNGYVYLNDVLEVSQQFKKLPDASGWYKVGEFALTEIIDGEVTTEELDMNNFVQDFATRESMPVDQFSHHSLYGNILFNYNGRLIIADTIQELARKTIYPTEYTSTIRTEREPLVIGDYVEYILTGGDATILINFKIDTTSGEKNVWRTQNIAEWQRKNYAYKNAIVLKGIIGYPDSRAKSCEIYLLEGGIYGKIASFTLKASSWMNYSYYYDGDRVKSFETEDYDSHGNVERSDISNFRGIFIGYHRDYLGEAFNTSILTDNEVKDTNRIQISELNNPYYFPAENSYQVGTGRIITTASNTEPLSTGQFGEYPLIVFTTKGIWTLFQGTGNVLFSSIKPLNGEVPANKEQITSVGVGVTYTTNLGLFLIQGREVTELTQLLQGSPNIDIQLDANFQLRLNHLQLIQKAEFLSDIDALGYIEDAKIAFDKKNNELIVTNPNKLYSYLYSFDSGVWGKISQSFDILVNAYPVTYAIVSNGGVYSISDENFLTEVETVLTTRPYKLDDSNNFILLHRALQRCEIETKQSTFAGFYVFGSNDLLTWQLISGNDRKSGRVTDILTTRAHTKVKYFVFVFASSVHKGDSINSLEVQFYNKLTNKLR